MMVMIKFGEDDHVIWLKFENKTVHIGHTTFVVVEVAVFVEVAVNGFDLVRQISMALAPTIIALACGKLLTQKENFFDCMMG